MITIAITPEIEKEIRQEMFAAEASIQCEMAFSSDLRNYETIERKAKYIKEMQEALIKGEL